MKIRFFSEDYSICQIHDVKDIDLTTDICFIAKTPEELSLVCPSANVPDSSHKVDAGWRCFRIDGTLDFSLVGILARISHILASNNISLFAVSTYDTDYFLVKHEHIEAAQKALADAGYELIS